MSAYEIERAARLENGAGFGKIAMAFVKADRAWGSVPISIGHYRAWDTGGNRRLASAKMKD
jgi:hypothetical protein